MAASFAMGDVHCPIANDPEYGSFFHTAKIA